MAKDAPAAPEPIRGNASVAAAIFVDATKPNLTNWSQNLELEDANGTAFSANARIPIERYRVIAGEDSTSEYESSPGARRRFCSRCGSPVFARVANDPDHIRIRLGTLDKEADAAITAHVWMGSKARWDRLTWDIPSFERGIDSARLSVS